jgi:hypothetical protein
MNNLCHNLRAFFPIFPPPVRCRSFHTFPCSPSLQSLASSRVGPLSLAYTKHRNQAISTVNCKFEPPLQTFYYGGTSNHLPAKFFNAPRRPSQYTHPDDHPLYRIPLSILKFSTNSTFRFDQSAPNTSPIMARKLENRSDSSLSPPPEESVASADTKASTGVAANGRKRKADVTATTTKRTKTSSTAGAETKPIDEVKAKSENGAIVKKTAKKPTTTRKKTQEDVLPLEERTADTKLRVGAHVSVAGGKSHLLPASRLV